MTTFRLIRTPPASASYNMQFDEQLFKRYLSDNVPVLRIYRWCAPSFTYGVGQRPEEVLDYRSCAADGIEVVKRITGGGILFHDNEITYSFVCAQQHVGELQGTLVSYRQIGAFLTRFYAMWGLRALFARDAVVFAARSRPHSLCSASYEKYDIVINARKIGGNAQKRTRQVVFQHGSIPLRVDWERVRRYAPALPEKISSTVTTLAEELRTMPSTERLEQTLIQAFAQTFDICVSEESPGIYETAMA